MPTAKISKILLKSHVSSRFTLVHRVKSPVLQSRTCQDVSYDLDCYLDISVSLMVPLKLNFLVAVHKSIIDQ